MTPHELAAIATIAAAFAAWFNYLQQRRNHYYSLRPEIHADAWHVLPFDDHIEIGFGQLRNFGRGTATGVMFKFESDPPWPDVEQRVHDFMYSVGHVEFLPVGGERTINAKFTLRFNPNPDGLELRGDLGILFSDDLGARYKTTYRLRYSSDTTKHIPMDDQLCPNLYLDGRYTKWYPLWIVRLSGKLHLSWLLRW